MSEWQPIESAPKDKHILGCHAGFGYVVVVYWKNGHFTDGAFPLIEVTHWMPLPDPPTFEPAGGWKTRRVVGAPLGSNEWVPPY
jgi:hypothetical protein